MRADGVFSGGGVKGIAFSGAIQAAEEAGYDEWVRLAGTSAGAIAAAALAVGYDAAGIRALLKDTDYQRLADYGGPLGAGRVYNWLFRRGLRRRRARAAPRGVPDRRRGEDQGRLPVLLPAPRTARPRQWEGRRARRRRGRQRISAVR